ncbi:MAG: flagellar basal body rod protein FlgB [Oleiphilaceae bacterium]|nr:flagellar basal body rod protein FlgB [Oleiphilaceae bacterium]
MAISFDKALGVHAQALELRSQRAEILANNLANADTPGFKARDIDFQRILKEQMGTQDALAMATTDGQHLPHGELNAADALLYRAPLQPSIDGNTVETQREIAEFSKNAMDFQASFQFLNSKFKGLSSAIKGE